MDSDGGVFTPQGLDGIIGNRDAILKLRDFAVSFGKGTKRKPIMLFGPPGTGKTAAVTALAKEFNWNIAELSASDYRDSATIERVLFPAANSRSIFGRCNLIVLDEIDELAKRFDAGAGRSILELIKRSRSPIIFVANDMWNRDISFLRNITEPVEFRKVDPRTVADLLRQVSAERGITISKGTTDAIAQRCKGDVRSALNDLAVFADFDKSEEDLMHQIGMRDVKNDIFYTLDKIFFSNTLATPLIAISDCDVDHDMLIRWIEENITKRYKTNGEINRAFGSLSDATIFASRAFRSQYYGFWRYMNVLMSSGVALSKSEYPSRSERYGFPKIITALGKRKLEGEKSAAVVAKLKKRIHANSRDIANYYVPLLARMVHKSFKEGNEVPAYSFFENEYGLGKDDVDALYNLINA